MATRSPVGFSLGWSAAVDGNVIRPVATDQSLAKEAFGGSQVRFSADEKRDRISVVFGGRVKIKSFVFDLDVGFVSAPACWLRPTPMPAQRLFSFWRVLLYPALYRGMIDRRKRSTIVCSRSR